MLFYIFWQYLYAFIYDYSAVVQESATVSFIGYSTYLTFTAQSLDPA